MTPNKSRIGVVGYCPPTRFDEAEAKRMIREAYAQIERDFFASEITIVSGLTNVGVLKIAYESAKERGWNTAGIGCKKANDFPWFSVDEKPMIVGENWGDESYTFIHGTGICGQAHENGLDAIVRIGLGKQSLRETAEVKKQGKKAYEYDLPVIN